MSSDKSENGGFSCLTFPLFDRKINCFKCGAIFVGVIAIAITSVMLYDLSELVRARINGEWAMIYDIVLHTILISNGNSGFVK